MYSFPANKIAIFYFPLHTKNSKIFIIHNQINYTPQLLFCPFREYLKIIKINLIHYVKQKFIEKRSNLHFLFSQKYQIYRKFEMTRILTHFLFLDSKFFWNIHETILWKNSICKTQVYIREHLTFFKRRRMKFSIFLCRIIFPLFVIIKLF